jgi:hypothetical protein
MRMPGARGWLALSCLLSFSLSLAAEDDENEGKRSSQGMTGYVQHWQAGHAFV